jgi:hypothetical protein
VAFNLKLQLLCFSKTKDHVGKGIKTMNEDKNQRLRFAQSLYRKRKHKKVERNEVSKTWTVFMVVIFVIALFFLVMGELFFMDSGIPIPEFFKRIAENLNS